jgi:hypothetical protein
MESDKHSIKSTFAWTPAIITFVLLECLVAAQALLAYQDHFFTVAQMRGRGINQGLPFVWHFAMWGDFFIVSGLAAYVIGRYIGRWRLHWILVSLAVGSISAVILSWTYTFSGIPEAHVQDYRLTAAGIVHLVYMAIALAVFTQFFFFTENISVRLLRVVSVLLFAHVFVGTHMALGILQLVHPLGWYPAQPLKSVFGWIIVGAVGLGLAWRNLGIVSARKSAGDFFVNILFVIFEFLTGQNPRTAEGYLKFLDYICGILLTTSYYFKLSWSGLQQGRDWMPLILLFIIALKYLLSRISVTQELAIGKSLFPPERVPDNLQSKDRLTITLQVIGFMALYMLLGWNADHIIFASAIMTTVAFSDFRTGHIIRKIIVRIFSDTKYVPLPTERNYQNILDRRAVVRWYLFGLPHLWKEAACIVGCAIACGISIYGYFDNADLDFSAYAILIGTLILNEIITIWWRIDRYLRFKGALGLLDAIYDKTRDTEDPVSASELAPTLELSDAEAKAALRYLSEKGLIKTFGAPDYAHINASGTDTIEKARQHPDQPQPGFGLVSYNTIINTTINNTIVHHMEGSTIQQAGAHSTLVQSVTYSQQDLDDLRRALDLLEKHVNELGLEEAAKRKALVQVATLKAQLTDEPDSVIIKQAGRTLRNITEGVIGGLIANGVQPSIWQFVGGVFVRLFGG